MAVVSRVLLVLLRLGQLASGAIVLGILGYLFHLVHDAGVSDTNGRLVYAAVIAALTIIAAIVFMAPFAYSFWAWPFDFFLAIAWLIVFCLLETLTRTRTCRSRWYRTYWGFYWGRWYRRLPPGGDVRGTGCSAWRTVLAFSFIAMMLYIFSGILGIYWTSEYGKSDTRGRRFTLFRRHREHRGMVGEKSTAAAPPTATSGTADQPAASA